MDPNAPLIVGKGVALTSTLGASLGALHAVVTRQPLGVFAFASGINSAIVGLTFFGLREYCVSPVLLNVLHTPEYRRRRAILNPRTTVDPTLATATWSDGRSEKLLDTAIAGSLSGGALGYWKYGPKRILPIAASAGFLCTLIQYAVNEAALFRIKLISQTRRGPAPPPPEPPRPLAQRLIEGFGTVVPVRKIEDEEYLGLLQKRKAEIEDRLAQVRKELEELRGQDSDGGGTRSST